MESRGQGRRRPNETFVFVDPHHHRREVFFFFDLGKTLVNLKRLEKKFLRVGSRLRHFSVRSFVYSVCL